MIDFKPAKKIDFQPAKKVDFQAYVPKQQVHDPSEPPTGKGPTGGWGYMEGLRPTKKAIDIAAIPITRANKAITGLSALETQMKRGSEFLKEPSFETALDVILAQVSKEGVSERVRGAKALVPWPGMAEESPTLGEAMARSWYEPLTRKKAAQWYAPVVDVAAETIMLGAGAAKRAALARPYHKGKSVIEKIQRLTRPEKIALRKRGFRPIEIQGMHPANARSILMNTSLQDTAAQLPKRTKGALNKLVASVKKAKRLRPQREKLISKEKARRVAIAEKLRYTGSPKEGALRSRGALKGEYAVPDFEAPAINAVDQYYLMASVRNSNMPHFRYRNTIDALMKVFSGELPTRGEIDLLQKHFGSGIAKALLGKRPLSAKAWEGLFNALNLPRATLASMDLSFPLRQGIILAPGHPKQWIKSFGRMLKAARFGEKGKNYARYLEDMAENSRYAGLRRKAGLEITEWGLTGAPTSTLPTREEQFYSSLAEWIPGVKWSERTFTTMSNQLRINVFDDVARSWQLSGITFDKNPQAYTKLAQFLNHATGRGSLWKFQSLATEMNALMFSPRYQISRPQVIYDAFASLGNAPARRVIARDLVKFVGAGATGLALAKMGGAEVETDPRSSDFGKVKVGNTRLDFWAGYQQIARLVAQLATGQAKSTSTGKIYPVGWGDILTRFLRMKMSPAAGLLWDIKAGETPIGETMELEEVNIPKQIWERTAPMFMQDVVDAIRYQGLDGAGMKVAASALAFFGAGVQTWEQSKWGVLSHEQDGLALETFGEEWDDLGPDEQVMLKREFPGLEQLRREAEYDRKEFPLLAELKAEQLEAGVQVQKKLPKKAQEELKRLKVPIGGLSKTLGEWSLNDKRYEEYIKSTTSQLTRELSRTLNAPAWGKMPDQAKRKYLEGAILRAKTTARAKIKGKARQEEMQRYQERRKLSPNKSHQ